MLISVQRLKRGRRLLESKEVRDKYQIKYQNFVFVLFNSENQTHNISANKPKQILKKEKIRIPGIVSLFKYLFNRTV